MDILILNGSPRRNGNTARLVEAFSKGAVEVGNNVVMEMVALKNIHGCIACEYCHEKEKGICIQKDDMQFIYPELKKADMLVLASPIYYYTMTGQLISALDRTYAFGALTNIKKTALILCSGAPNMYEPAIAQYKGVINWWGAENAGIFTFPGITLSHSLKNTSEEYLNRLYEFGKTLV